MSFNEIRRNLEDAASREQRIRELAEQLHRRGLAMTKESARQLAESLVETERKVQQRYQEKKQEVTRYNDLRSTTRQQTPPEPHFLKSPVELSPTMSVKEAAGVSEDEARVLSGEGERDDGSENPMPEPAVDDTAAQDDEAVSDAESEQEAESTDAAERPDDVHTQAAEEIDTGEEAAAEDDDAAEADIAEDDGTEGAPDEGVVADEPATPRREDLGKKHGIDISEIFNVNK